MELNSNFFHNLSVINSYQQKFTDKEHIIKFKGIEEEIFYYKEVKPKMLSYGYFYEQYLKIAQHYPLGTPKQKSKYIKSELVKLNGFFTEHFDFILYHRARNTDKDGSYFRAGHLNKSDLLARFFAGNKIEALLLQTLTYLQHNRKEIIQDEPIYATEQPSKTVKWTLPSKTDLAELIFGLHHLGCFNNGTANLVEVVKFCEQAFEIPLGDFYQLTQNIRRRKNDRTLFLDMLRDAARASLARK